MCWKETEKQELKKRGILRSAFGTPFFSAHIKKIHIRIDGTILRKGDEK